MRCSYRSPLLLALAATGLGTRAGRTCLDLHLAVGTPLLLCFAVIARGPAALDDWGTFHVTLAKHGERYLDEQGITSLGLGWHGGGRDDGVGVGEEKAK